MVPDDATNRGTRHRMMTCQMADYAADGGAFDAAMRVRDDRKRRKR
jgi:hypothetical protein